MRKLCIVPALLTALTAAVPASADEWSKKYSLSGKPALEVVTDDGNVEIVTADQNEIEARVTTVGWSIGERGVHITESQSGNEVRIEVKTPHNHIFFGVGRHSLRLELRIPRQADLDVRTGDGNVRTQPVAGRIRIETGDGNISSDGMHGDIRLHTGDGRIEGENFDGALDADTGDGRMNVHGRFDTLNLKTGDGSIDARVDKGSKMSTDWTLHTGDGSIVVRLPENFAADLDAHTGDGHITLGIPLKVFGPLDHSSVRGKLNGGGPTLRLRSGDGSIHLEKL